MHPRFLLPIVLSLACGSLAVAQPRPRSGAEFPAAEFNERDRVAFYLWQYDSFAWASSDKLNAEAQSLGPDITNRLGEEWFCYKRDSTWHAVYGKFDETADRYDAVLHYASVGHQIVRSQSPVEAGLGDRFGRALSIAKHRVPRSFAKMGVRFNSFVREREDGGIDVWIVPAWQPNGWIVYGAEFHYVFDAAGRTVRDSVVRVGELQGARPDTTATVQLKYAEPGIPTVAEILFLRLYTKRFAHLRVFTRDWVTELFNRPGQQAWIHALREERTSSARH